MKKTLLPFIVFLSFICQSSFAQDVDMSLFSEMKARMIGPAGMSGRVTAIDVNLSKPEEIFVGAAAGGIWKSQNAGQTWEHIFNHESTASIGDIKIFQQNPNIIYVGTGEGNPRNSLNSGRGIFKTIDGGKTWKDLGLKNTRQIHRVLVDPSNSDRVWAGAMGSPWAANPERGVYYSNDGGDTWDHQLYIDASTGVSDLVMDPTNPNKLIASMWTHLRTPDYFTSGGEKSGIFLTYNGGKDWKQLDETNGLPDGKLGRIGLAISPVNNQIVYAYIESKDNAIYKSEDGGENWKRMSKSGDSNIGGRPFYYADIFADTQNENRLYSIATEVTVSDDGGKTWSVFASGSKVHTDHHAWWSHPENADYILLGHDGGLNISYDKGKKWGFAEQLPLAQFYHIRVDDEVPYNIYGGLQDNGSWKGPSQTWFKGGIRNFYWQRLSVGDGFDVVPDPKNADYGYAMGQAGNLVRYHTKSGHLKKIKPIHPDGVQLRFNWNSGIGIDPHDEQTIYYGSQFLHKTSDFGDSWEIISPDLTTNDPNKQRMDSGGLTYDVSGAENHTTIVTISPSPVEKGMIWVGTDDGKLQLTRDDGKNWKDLTSSIKGVPNHTWIPHIKASSHDPAEAFVVFGDHRRNNWTPYILHTNNYGKTWNNLVGPNKVDGFVYTVEQDPVEPNLLFCGTDVGLYVSFNKGKTWQRWQADFPTVPVSDLIVHERASDLVIGTFGLGILVLDDITALRAFAKKQNTPSLLAFDVPESVQAMVGESIGYRAGKVGDHLFEGENKKYGAVINIFHPNIEDKVKASIQIKNSDGTVVRTISYEPKKGVNRINWRLGSDPVRGPGQKKSPAFSKREGFSVPPGNYTFEVAYLDEKSSGQIKVLPDPRKPFDSSLLKAKTALVQRHFKAVKTATAISDRIEEVESGLKALKGKLDDHQEVKKAVSEAQNKLTAYKTEIVGKKVQGFLRNPAQITSMLRQSQSLLDHIQTPSSPNQINQVRLVEEAVAMLKKRFDAFDKTEISNLKTMIEKAGIQLF